MPMTGALDPVLSVAPRIDGSSAQVPMNFRLEVLIGGSILLLRPCGAPHYSAARSTVHTLAQMGPPILNVAAARGFFTCKPAGAWPSSCSALQPIMAIPVAPMGCPLAISPPDVLMAHSPPGAALPSTQYWAPLPGSALPITSVPSAPIMVKQSCTSATLTSSGLRCAIWYAVRMARYAPAGCSTSRPALRMGSVACPQPATSTHSDLETPSVDR